MLKKAALVCFMLILLLVGTFVLKEKEEKQITGEYTVGVVLKAMDSEHWLSVRSGMREEAKAKGIRLIVVTPENEAAYGEQNKIIEDLLGNNIDALVVSPVNLHHTTGWISLAKERGIRLLTVDEKINGIPCVGSNNYNIGRLAAREMARLLPPGSQVGVMGGSANQEAHIRRMEGFRDGIREETELELVASLADETKYRQATIQSENLLRLYPELKGMFVTSAIMTLGVADATRSREMKLIGVDTQADALRALKNGSIDAMISQNGREIGVMAIDTVLEILQGREVPGSAFIENEVIRDDNADEYLQQEEF